MYEGVSMLFFAIFKLISLFLYIRVIDLTDNLGKIKLPESSVGHELATFRETIEKILIRHSGWKTHCLSLTSNHINSFCILLIFSIIFCFRMSSGKSQKRYLSWVETVQTLMRWLAWLKINMAIYNLSFLIQLTVVSVC